MSRLLKGIILFVLLAYLALIVFALFHQAPAALAMDENPLGNPPGMRDRLVTLDSADVFARGDLAGVRIAPDGRLCLAPFGHDPSDYPAEGSWTSAAIPADFGFTELLPSFNASIPPSTGLRVELRVRIGSDWSPWLYFGSWGQTPSRRNSVTSFRAGDVFTDTLLLREQASAIQVRLLLYSFEGAAATGPAVRRVGLCYSGVSSSPRPADHLMSWSGELPVPFRAQGDAPKALGHQICSPTSVSMVLAYYGIDRPTVENARAMYDPEHHMFGNWMRACQRAGELGLEAHLERFRSWEPVKRELAAGHPLVASIRFRKGEFPSAVFQDSEGHLLVIRGFTPQGDVIVNDPASRARGNGAVYKAAELAHAWFDHGGVAYVITRNSR